MRLDIPGCEGKWCGTASRLFTDAEIAERVPHFVSIRIPAMNPHSEEIDMSGHIPANHIRGNRMVLP